MASAMPPVKIGPGSLLGREKIKPKNGKATLKRLIKETKGSRQGLFGILLLSIVIAFSSALAPRLIGAIVNQVNTLANASKYIIFLFLLYCGDYLARFLQEYFMAPIGQKIVHQLRCTMFKKMSVLPLSFFDKTSHGDLISRMTNDIDLISSTFSESFAKLVILAITFLSVIVMMFSLSLPLSFLVIIAGPFVFLLINFITKRTKVLFSQQQVTLGKLSGQMEESISGYSVIKAYCQEQNMINSFKENNDKLQELGIKANIWTGILMPAINVMQNIDFIFIVIVGSLLADKGIITIGLISSFVLYARQFMRPLNELASIYNTLQSALAGAERVFEIMDNKEENVSEGIIKETSIKGDIEFKEVCFAYVKDKPVIKNFSIKINHGIKVALVGETGCGKTTLINLLTRMYDVTSGQILLDGLDIKEYNLKQLRSYFGVVLQDSEIFNDTVYANLCYGLDSINKARCKEVCQSVGADAFILRLPQGYESVLTNDGMLSEGERQLLTIARSIMVNAPMIILDEATSNVDTRTEKNIKSAIDNMTRGRTSFFIAHRLSTIKDSDLIIHMEHGEILEVGTHEELLKLNNGYAKMYRLQVGD